MEQRKRPGKDGELGYYTSWEKSKSNGCIYCGESVTTREHTPSKTFLIEPYPENLPTIPACFACNNGYSEDERLQRTLQEQIWMENGKVYFKPDEKRILRILLKLARGHAGLELDYVNFDNTETEVWYDFVFNMSQNDIEEFNNIPVCSLYPEVGSRGMYVIQNLSAGDAQTFAGWIDVQNGQYRYQVSYDNNGSIVVKIVIFEFLYYRVVL